jgi:tRNA (cmo5U34)-methyltransferase
METASHDAIRARPPADNLIPAADKWAFDDSVTHVFEAMLENSIPGYHDMRSWVTRFALRFLPEDDGLVLDMGASRGDALAPLLAARPRCRFRAVEVSEPMRNAMRSRFHGQPVAICDHDLRYDLSVFEDPADVVLSVLTLMFVPIEYRTRLVNAIYRGLKPGGALLLVEKTIQQDPLMDEIFNEQYYRFKADNGYTAEAIYRKKLSLEGVLVPLTQQWNEDTLRAAGFQHVQVFWRAANFCGLLAVKEGRDRR